jgi:hypothetical protein
MIVLLVGGSIVLTAASSKPGMFLHPIKRVTHGWTRWFTRTTVVSPPSWMPAGEPAVYFPEPVPEVVENKAGSETAAVEAIQVTVHPTPLISPPCGAAAATPALAHIVDVVEPVVPTAVPPTRPSAAGRALAEADEGILGADVAPMHDSRMDVSLVAPAELIPGGQGASTDDRHTSHQHEASAGPDRSSHSQRHASDTPSLAEHKRSAAPDDHPGDDRADPAGAHADHSDD